MADEELAFAKPQIMVSRVTNLLVNRTSKMLWENKAIGLKGMACTGLPQKVDRLDHPN